MTVPAFSEIEDAAVIRRGRAALDAALVQPKSGDELRAVPDDHYLSAMTLRTFRAGLKHSVVDARWPAFEKAFGGFAPDPCARLSDEAIEALLLDRGLIRNLAKLRAVRTNAASMVEIAREAGSMGAWLAAWPADDVVGLWEALGRRFTQLGGNSAAYFLRMVGKDTFILTDSVAAGLRHWGALADAPRTSADRRAAEAAIVAWSKASGRPLCQVSQILAMSCD